jgi:probable HAF family extracellular repeat protein
MPNPITMYPPADPFFWTPNRGMIDLGTLGGVYGAAYFMNNRDQVVGASSTASATDPGSCNGFPDNGDFNCHPFLWERGKLRDLNTTSIGGNPEWVEDINDAGEIVGFGAFSNAPSDPYIWRKGVATDLGSLNGCGGNAGSINAHSQVVGFVFKCQPRFRAFLWEAGSIVDLNTLIPHGSALRLAFASAINDRGEIDGTGVPPGVPTKDAITRGHAYLLIPCDENHPNIKGCDYSLVFTPVSSPSTVHVGAGLNFNAIRAMLHGIYTNRRFGSPIR